MLQSITIQLIQSKIEQLAPGEKFTLPKLLGAHWDSINSGGDIGKEFKEKVREQKEISGVRLVSDKASPALSAKKV